MWSEVLQNKNDFNTEITEYFFMNFMQPLSTSLATIFWYTTVDPIDMVEGVSNGFLPYTRFLGFLEFSGYHQWQQESQ